MLLPAPDGGKLLEIGCGTGHWSEYFCNKGFDVTGVDISEQMIAIARQKKVSRAVFDVSDAAKLPFADATFDVAAAITALEFAADPAEVVAEMIRCVKKAGGTLIVGTLNRLSAHNRGKQRKAASMYASANLFSPSEMRTLLSSFGEPRVLVAGFVPRWDLLLWLSPLLEWAGGLTGNEHGAFLAAKVAL